MSKSLSPAFELPDDLVVGRDNFRESEDRMGAGSTLPQDLLELGMPLASAGQGRFPAFLQTQPASQQVTQPANLQPNFRKVAAAPQVATADLPGVTIVAPQLPTGRMPGDGPQPKRVLVVDDDATARLYLRSRLMLRGHAYLQEASSGAQALELVKAQRFDALLLDVDMGEQNGFEVCRAVRSYVRSVSGKQPRIYMITSRNSMLDKMRAKMAGADAFLSKPPHPGELSELLAQL